MMALYLSLSVAKNLVSAGSIPGGAVQSRVTGVPPDAVATSQKPYAKLTSTVSPRGGAQLAATVMGAGANAPLEIAPNHVVPREKNGSTTLFARCPKPTAISTAPAPVALIESSILAYSARNSAVSVANVVSPAWAAPSRSLLPIHALTNVGCAAIITCTCVRPPRNSWVSGLE